MVGGGFLETAPRSFCRAFPCPPVPGVYSVSAAGELPLGPVAKSPPLGESLPPQPGTHCRPCWWGNFPWSCAWCFPGKLWANAGDGGGAGEVPPFPPPVPPFYLLLATTTGPRMAASAGQRRWAFLRPHPPWFAYGPPLPAFPNRSCPGKLFGLLHPPVARPWYTLRRGSCGAGRTRLFRLSGTVCCWLPPNHAPRRGWPAAALLKRAWITFWAPPPRYPGRPPPCLPLPGPVFGRKRRVCKVRAFQPRPSLPTETFGPRRPAASALRLGLVP